MGKRVPGNYICRLRLALCTYVQWSHAWRAGHGGRQGLPWRPRVLLLLVAAQVKLNLARQLRIGREDVCDGEGVCLRVELIVSGGLFFSILATKYMNSQTERSRTVDIALVVLDNDGQVRHEVPQQLGTEKRDRSGASWSRQCHLARGLHLRHFCCRRNVARVAENIPATAAARGVS